MDFDAKVERWMKIEKGANTAMNSRAWKRAAQLYEEFLDEVARDLDPKDINVLWVKRHYSEALMNLGRYDAGNQIQMGLMQVLVPSNRPMEGEVAYDLLRLRMEYVKMLRAQYTSQDMKTAGEVLSSARQKSIQWLGKEHLLSKKMYKWAQVNDLDRARLERKETRRRKRESLNSSFSQSPAVSGATMVEQVQSEKSVPRTAIVPSEPQTMTAPAPFTAEVTRPSTIDLDSSAPRTGRRLMRSTSELLDVVGTQIRTTSTPRLGQDKPNVSYDFDISDADLWSGDAKARANTEKWFEYRLAKTHSFLGMRTPLKSGPGKRVRIAILDTGLNKHHDEVAALLAKKGDDRRIQGWKSWLPDLNDMSKTLPGDEDEVGHGTHCAMTAHRVAPDADIFVARIFRYRNNVGKDYVKEAIEHAINVWQVDIISMSFSLADDNIEGKARAAAAIEANRGRALFLAAASNDGENRSRTFPACHADVLCIYCCDAYGKPSRLNPGMYTDDTNLRTLGQYVRAPHKGKDTQWSSGTSIATAVAAGITALVLEFSRQKGVQGQRSLDDVRDKLKTKQGMVDVFRLMQNPREFQQRSLYLCPWKLLSTDFNRGDGIEARRDIAARIWRALSY